MKTQAAIFDKTIDQLATLVEEGERATKRATSRFIEPAQGTLRRAHSRRHHIVFGRRGSGKSSLLYKSAEDLTSKEHPVAYVDLEPFKGHHYPDVLISVLLASFTRFHEWLQHHGREAWWMRWLARAGVKKYRNVQKRQSILDRMADEISQLSEQLHLADGTNLVETRTENREESSEAGTSAKTEAKAAGLTAGVEAKIAASLRASSGDETREEYTRSKIDYLHRKVLDYQSIFHDFTEMTSGDGYLFLDDLYHIHRNDQPNLLDYFHRILKGNNMWIKSGTIKNRSTWYVHGPQPVGLKLGDDAGELNLDLTLEKFSVSRDFLKSILASYVREAKAPPIDKFLSEGGLDRLVLASGGVTRDFLGIFRRSIDEARERLSRNPNHHRGSKISAEDVNVAAGGYGETKKEEFQRDTLEDREQLEDAFNRIRRFCLDAIKKNVFLVDQDFRGEENDLIQELIDLRLIHHAKSRVTVSARPGQAYRALLLDVSQYTGERKRRDVEMIDFWKAANRETIRAASMIYDAGMDHQGLDELVQKRQGHKSPQESRYEHPEFDLGMSEPEN